MRTHGDVSFDNVHPYAVGGGVYLMHNGILHTGNAEDRTRSDTSHFIENYLHDAVTACPDVIHDWQFRARLGRFIRKTNRFALMGPTGKPVIINWRTGVIWNGAWMSNTYAWTASLARDLKHAA
jgi:hypothetical protein